MDYQLRNNRTLVQNRGSKEKAGSSVLQAKRVMITGALGFIGCNLVSSLSGQGVEIAGLDIKRATRISLLRERELSGIGEFTQRFCDITDSKSLLAEFERFHPDTVIHLAAEAGVRSSIDTPSITTLVNVQGFANVLEASKTFAVKHLVYASSSSVYGNSSTSQSREVDPALPRSLYAATKVANEAMAQAYSNMYGMMTSGLRIFTAYGPFGRPDMAIFKFTEKMLQGDTIEIFNNGNHSRDFTFVDDVVRDILSILALRGGDDPMDLDGAEGLPDGRSEIFNIGTGSSTSLQRLLEILEAGTGRKAKLNRVGPSIGDVTNTHADTNKLDQLVGYRPRVEIEEGVEIFLRWHKKQFPERW